MTAVLLVLQLAMTPEGACGAIAGRILDAESGRPLAGAAVLLPDLDRGVLTDSLGRYHLDLIPAGPQHLDVRLVGFSARTVHALVPCQGVLEINVALTLRPLPLPPIEVRGPIAVRGVEAGTTQFPDREVSGAAIANHPSLAEPDALHALGGGEVAINPETPGGLHLRGGASDQTAYL